MQIDYLGFDLAFLKHVPSVVHDRRLTCKALLIHTSGAQNRLHKIASRGDLRCSGEGYALSPRTFFDGRDSF